jgi:hypothetical protein
MQSKSHHQASETNCVKEDGKQTVKQVCTAAIDEAMLSTSSCLQGFQQLPGEEDVGQQLQVDEQGGAGPATAVSPSGPEQHKAAQVVH